MQLHYLRVLCAFALVLFVAGTLSACDSNPVDGDQEHPFEPLTADLVHNGSVVADIRSTNTENGVLLDTLEISEGFETALLRARFYNDDGDLIETPDDDAYQLGLEIEDAAVAEIEQHEGEDWVFHLVGLSVGETRLVFTVDHGTHADLGPFRIPVRVVEHGTGELDGEEHSDHDHDEA